MSVSHFSKNSLFFAEMAFRREALPTGTIRKLPYGSCRKKRAQSNSVDFSFPLVHHGAYYLLSDDRSSTKRDKVLVPGEESTSG